MKIEIGNLILESGNVLYSCYLEYTIYGQPNQDHSNYILVCHPFSASSRIDEWWGELLGQDKAFDPQHYYIICFNSIGSCYGSISPQDVNPINDQPYGTCFPFITIKDIVAAFSEALKRLEISKIEIGIGASFGGQILLEWILTEPQLFNKACLIATNAVQSSWGIAHNEAQRIALKVDPTYNDINGGANGIIAARAIAMILYRHQLVIDYKLLRDSTCIDFYSASSYIYNKGLEFSKRFHHHSYWFLSKAMDSHDISRGRNNNIQEILKTIKTKCLIVGIDKDLLFPLSEQLFLHENIVNSRLEIVSSKYGHDAFLVETDKFNEIFKKFI